MTGLSPDDYANLLAFRAALRRFDRWSEVQARNAGLTPAQHQLLLAVKGHADERGPTIREVADYLGVQHHSAVGLTDRAVDAGLVVRSRDVHDARLVRLALTVVGEERIAALSELHVAELVRLTPLLAHLTEHDHEVISGTAP
ncbi:MAG TPA: MarR family winged helix-turn-helix transcriptional regulator [Pseudonocardiaceae bacterium]|jgi:DNA-binding MarR family transcriptional regulator|nr:MarR family winged helix-turn-helix transcriptional regulator [Pseudonocardiaceae bacterium]